ncbi:MAG: hypothetical protein ACKVOU_03865 [Cytophagales bacterium]
MRYHHLPDLIEIFEENTPFSYEEIYYFEDKYHPEINSYILQNIDRIQSIFDAITDQYNKPNLKFIYIPHIVQIQNQNGLFEQLLSYQLPNLSATEFQKVLEAKSQTTTASFSNFVLDSLGYEGQRGAAFFRCTNREFDFETPIVFEYQKISFSTVYETELFLKEYVKRLTFKYSDVSYCPSDYNIKDIDRVEDFADYCFDHESHRINEEIQDKIRQLKAKGHIKLLLNSILITLPELRSKDLTTPSYLAKPSRLQVTQNFDIMLPDFNNLKIHLTPLPKALFFLFLRHPEGILLKELAKYRTELLEIYKLLSNKEEWSQMQQSIKEMTNPTNNSINEKCSRIKEAFVKHFDEKIAEHYFITGQRGEPKQIILNRSLVEWLPTSLSLNN